MSPKLDLVLGIVMLAVIVPAGVWLVYDGIRSGKTSFNANSGTGLDSSPEIPALRDKTPGFFWFTISIYAIITLAALILGLSSIFDAVHGWDKSPPNTALEPTADPRFSLAGSAGFAMRQFGGGSAFVR